MASVPDLSAVSDRDIVRPHARAAKTRTPSWCAEIARLMDVSVGTVGTYLHRARNDLKRMLG